MPRHCTTCLDRFPDDIGLCPADQTPLIDVATYSRPVVGAFRLGERIGGGGRTDVYQGHDLSGCFPPAAVKVLREPTQEARARLKTEVEVGRRLRSPRVPRFLAGRADGEDEACFVATELRPGVSARALFEAEGALPPDQLVILAAHIAEALQAAEAAGICHRAVRPEHILVSGSGEAFTASLFDFGAARIEGFAPAAGALTAAAPEYMAPEALRGRAVFASDRYALGVVLYELGTGRNPFQDETIQGTCWRHENFEPAAPRPESGTLPWPAGLVRLILSLLSKEPGDRPRPAEIIETCRDLTDELIAMERARSGRIEGRFPQRVLAGLERNTDLPPVASFAPTLGGAAAPQEPGTSRPPRWVRRGARSSTGVTRGAK